MKSTLVNMVSVLGTITLVSAVAVSGFYLLTKDAIDLANQNKINNAISEVIPGFDNVPAEEQFFYAVQEQDTNDSLLVYPARKGDELIGYAIKTHSTGYGGTIELMVGVLADGKISSVSVISESETPGLGHKMSTEGVLVDQFKNVDPNKTKLAVKKGDNGDIDAITAATISSKAFCKAVNRAIAVSDALNNNKHTDASSGATNNNKEDKK